MSINEQTVICPLCNQSHHVDMETVSCSLCGTDDTEYLFSRRDLAIGLDGTFDMVRCRKCGLIYMNPRPTQEAIGYYYPSSYDVFSLPDIDSAPSAWARWQRAAHVSKRCRLVAKHSSGGRLLDIGCANGRFLHHLRHFGSWERVGVELVPEVAEEGRQRYGLDIHTGTFEAINFPSGSFDVVTMWDVIEHVHDPAETLRQASRVLRPGGMLLLSYPTADSLGARLFGRYWVGYEIPRHLHVYTRRTLGFLLAQAGLQQIEEWSLYGSDYAFADSVCFTIRGNNLPTWLHGIARRFLRGRLWRWSMSPIFLMLERLGLSSMVSVVCRRV